MTVLARLNNATDAITGCGGFAARHEQRRKHEHDNFITPTALHKCNAPFPSEAMRMWPISTRVNKPENDDPTILDEIVPGTEAA
jgi:hypothetical protein